MNNRFGNSMIPWEIMTSAKDVIELIDNILGDFNKTQVNYNSKMDYLPLSYHIRDKAGKVIAGVNAFSCWQMLYISEFYVEENYRRRQLGTRLLTHVEQTAKKAGAIVC